MNEKYAKAYTEVLEIINHFSLEEYSKIPEQKIKFFKENQDKNYIYKINPEIDLEKQYISKEAEAVLVKLFKDYFATEKQKNILENLLKQNQKKLEEFKRDKYNPNDIFKNNQSKNDKINNTLMPTIIEKEKWYTKILKFFKSILKK